jgi:chloride channel protein, CIC family
MLSGRGIDILKLKENDLMDKITVSEAMFRNLITIIDSSSVREAARLLRSSSHKGLPVVDSDGKLRGIVTQEDINNALNSEKGEMDVASIMTFDLILCYPEETLKVALEKLGERDIGRIPVVDYNDTRHLVGLITRKGIITAYNLGLRKKSGKEEA